MSETSFLSLPLLLELLETVAITTVLAYVFSKTSAFDVMTPIGRKTRRRNWVWMYAFFTGMAILGTYLGIPVMGAIANTRATGAVLAGLLGGPWMGLGVGLTAGLHRYSLGGFTDVACGLSTVVEGLVGGFAMLAWRWRRANQPPAPLLAFSAAFVAECLQMLIILAVARPYVDAEALVSIIAIPMILMNAIGAGLFASIVQDQQRGREQHGAHYARLALEVGEKSIALLKCGLTEESAGKLVRLLRETLPVGAVAVTGREQLLAFEGIGADHHHVGSPVGSKQTMVAVQEGRVHFLDGERDRYQCPISADCPLSAALIVPLTVEDEVVGTIKLFEPHGRRFPEVFRSFGEGIARLMSAQLLLARFEEQRKLLLSSELKLVQAQINPHFLFNALAAIRAVIRVDPEQGRDLLGHLSDFLRSNLKAPTPDVTLAEELNHVGSYLEIEKARFGERLSVEVDVPKDYAPLRLPTFTLQPLVENAIKHGLRDKVEDGVVRISAQRTGNDILLAVEDNGGTYCPNGHAASGLGLSLVHRRVESWGGPGYGTRVDCQPGERTRVTVRIPSRRAL